MAKQMKFNLFCDNKLVCMIEDLQNNFSIKDILVRYNNHLLHRWIENYKTGMKHLVVSIQQNPQNPTIIKTNITKKASNFALILKWHHFYLLENKFVLFMKKTEVLVVIGMCLVLTGCGDGTSGVTQEEYNKVVAQRDTYKQQLEDIFFL